jgi:Tol biopolymer transport system component
LALPPGTRLGPYEVVALLGAGGMGEVYRATDTKLDREVAIKVLPESLSTDPERLVRFEREAKTLASLNHPNIAHIHGFEDSTGVPALVMELVEGPTLADRISKGLISIDEALPIAKQIAQAIEAAHEHGIIHRDLKPANIKVRGDGTVKVLDFGLAKLADPPASAVVNATLSPTLSLNATMAGVILGTAAYMAPEQARGKSVDKRADVWAFGAVLFEMLTGTPAFPGDDVPHILARVIDRDPDWSALPRALSPVLRMYLRRCLAKDARQRIRDIGDVRLALEGVFDVDTAAQSPSPAEARSAWAPWVVAASCAAALVALLVLWAPWRAEKPAARPLVRLDVDLGAEVSLPVPTSGGSNVAISPDGTRLVYASGMPTKLFARRLDQVQAAELPGTQGATAPSFSPDGQWVVFVAGGRANKISVEGGAVVPLGRGANVIRANWAGDGSVFMWAFQKIQRIPADEGPTETVAEIRGGELGLVNPEMLPGGTAVLLAADNPGPVDKTTIEVVTLADHQRRTLVTGGASPRYLATSDGVGHLVYVNGSTLFAIPFDPKTLTTRGTAVPLVGDIAHENAVGVGQFDVSRTGTLVYRRAIGGASVLTTVKWVNARGQKEPLRLKPGAYQDLSLSPDGTRIALSVTDGGTRDVWVYDPQRDAMTRLTSGGMDYRYPCWTPDGRVIVFSSVGDGIFQTRADGASQPQALIKSKTVQYPWSITPDGKQLAYSELAGNRQLWTMPLQDQGGQLKAGTPQPFLKSSFNDVMPSFSPDGRWLAYQSNESGANEVYVRAFPPAATGQGGKWQVSNAGGTVPRWSRVGQDLLYQSGDQLMAARYTVKGDVFVVEKPRVWTAKLSAAGIANGAAWDVTPDGQRVAVLTPVESADAMKQEHEVVFLLNFFDELRRRVPIDK